MRLRNPGGIDQAIPILVQVAAELGNTMISGGGIAAARDAGSTGISEPTRNSIRLEQRASTVQARLIDCTKGALPQTQVG
jgi:hypothetical protein